MKLKIGDKYEGGIIYYIQPISKTMQRLWLVKDHDEKYFHSLYELEIKCKGLKDRWKIPTIIQLEYIYTIKQFIGEYGLDSYYWSCSAGTEYNSKYPTYLIKNFYTGAVLQSSKDMYHHARLVKEIDVQVDEEQDDITLYNPITDKWFSIGQEKRKVSYRELESALDTNKGYRLPTEEEIQIMIQQKAIPSNYWTESSAKDPNVQKFDTNYLRVVKDIVYNLKAGDKYKNGIVVSYNDVEGIGLLAANTDLRETWSYSSAIKIQELGISNSRGFRLPTKEELQELYVHRKEICNLDDLLYWSSSEYSLVDAFAQDFSTGMTRILDKAQLCKIRLVREFTIKKQEVTEKWEYFSDLEVGDIIKEFSEFGTEGRNYTIVYKSNNKVTIEDPNGDIITSEVSLLAEYYKKKVK